MALPGKLCIGILEEDNPLKSYFRFKPLLVANGEMYEPYDVGNEFPENGCIRIVPDKNESSRFKARMRRMGGFCEVDLREHPDENDKIRPNKNYHGDESEPNAYIIYSDVVREPAEAQIVEIVRQEAPADAEQIALSMRTPRTARVVLLENGEASNALWSHAPIADVESGIALTRTDIASDLTAAQRFDLPGFGGETLSFYIARPGKALYETAPAAPASMPTPAPKPAPRMDKPERFPAQRLEIAAELAPQIEKPWITRDTRIAPQQYIDPSLSPREQAMALQTGMNPRRGRSLKEIIEEKWRRSRIDQLGHPVPGSVTGKPVISPVDRAIEAVSEAWEHLGARQCLVQALARVEGLVKAIAGGEDAREAADRAERLREYEAIRAELIKDIERLREEHEAAKENLLSQVREENAGEIAAHLARVNELEAREAELRERADAARRVAESAERAVAELTDEKLEARLSEFAVNCRALDLIAATRGGNAEEKRAIGADLRRVDEISVREITQVVRARFTHAGFAVTEDEAINLLACFALGDSMLLTGPTGCGKTASARLLLGALGLFDTGRVHTWRSFANQELPAPEPKAELPIAVFADDVNTAPDACARVISELCTPGVKLVMTAQDNPEGHPIPTRLLDRSFLIRLRADAQDSPWGGMARAEAKSGFVLTESALKTLFTPEARNIAPQVAKRLRTLREELAKYNVLLSRRTLDALWRYCAAVTPHLSGTPLETFDLAFAQRALPAALSIAGVEALHAMHAILDGMPRSQALLRQPLAIEI